jgi:Tfp pilus assembly protein PilO
MKKDKSLFFLLISIFIYVYFIPPYEEKISQLKDEIKYLNLKIEKEKTILQKKDEILKKVEKTLKIAKKNEKLIYADKNDSEIQSEIQNFLKKEASSVEADFLGASWEEPLIYEKFGYKELPMMVSVKGTPPIMGRFFANMFSFDKIINIKSLEIGKTRPYSVLFAFKISSYKLLTEKENKK